MARRSYGTGSLYLREDRNGRETWYGSVRVHGRLVRRAIGPKRPPGAREGLTKAQAEARLRDLIDELAAAPRSRSDSRSTKSERATSST